jgi:hypothetical protein
LGLFAFANYKENEVLSIPPSFSVKQIIVYKMSVKEIAVDDMTADKKL